MTTLTFVLYLVVVSSIFALLEIQAEGENGWAAKFPTWRVKNGWTKVLLGEKPLTGYHLYFFLFMVLVAHCPYGLGIVKYNTSIELRILSFLVLFFTIEDFLWFVLNPHFGLRKFKPQFIWWHAAQWWWIMPRDYWIAIPLGLILYMLSYKI